MSKARDISGKILSNKKEPLKFGSEQFFKQYIENQLEKEKGDQTTLYRIHFSMTSYMIETFGLKESLVAIQNLNNVCEAYSKKLVREGGISQ